MEEAYDSVGYDRASADVEVAFTVPRGLQEQISFLTHRWFAVGLLTRKLCMQPMGVRPADW